MHPFTYRSISHASDLDSMTDGAFFLAGGTTLLDLMKLDVMRPNAIVDINELANEYGRIESGQEGLYLGALAHMADAAVHADIQRDYPMISQSLLLAASPQLRNMATLGGNVLQRTRCSYFRDTRWTACNKRNPGSGCAAMDGNTRKQAVLGVSPDCIATYPGDFAQALIALRAQVAITGPAGDRIIAFDDLHRLPDRTPDQETNLRSGELITGFQIPAGPWTRRSLYLKIRDRESYEFALASAAVALEMEGDIVKQARIALGGVATKPWLAAAAEEALIGRPLTEANAELAAKHAFAEAKAQPGNAYKIELGQRTLVRALLQAAQMEV